MKQLLHLHWQPINIAKQQGRLMVWVEDGTGPAPLKRRGRANKHPFATLPPSLKELLGQVGLKFTLSRSITLRLELPTGVYGPQPSPELIHHWDLVEGDTPTQPDTWRIEAVSLTPTQAMSFLLGLLTQDHWPGDLAPGNDCLYWQAATWFVMDLLQQEKFKPSRDGYTAYADLTSPVDQNRQSALQQIIPALSLAQSDVTPDQRTPEYLVKAFINIMVGAMGGAWYQTAYSGLWGTLRDKMYQWLLKEQDEIQEQAALRPYNLHLHRHYSQWCHQHPADDSQEFRLALHLISPEEPVATAEEPDWRLEYALQSRSDPSLLIPAEQVWQAKGNPLKRLSRNFKARQKQLLADLGTAARFFIPLQPSLQSAQPVAAELSTQQAFQFLRQTAPLLKTNDVAVLVPAWWSHSTQPLKVDLKISPANPGEPNQKSQLGLDTLVRYRWELSVGQTKLTEEEFKSLVAFKSPLVNLEGRWAHLDPQQVEAAIGFWEKRQLEAEVDLTQAMRLGLGLTDNVDGLPLAEVTYEGWVADWMQEFTGDEKLTLQPAPTGLQGQLRPYQEYGYAWLDFMRRWNMGACLADDMGLGKTVQTLTMLLKEKEENGKLPGPVLVVCPTSVVFNWGHETHQFTPALKTLAHQGPTRLRDQSFIDQATQVDLVITSYTLVRLDIKMIQAVNWFGIVLDEAQNIKNPDTKRTKAIISLSAQFRVALTGTPVENRLSELWSIMHFLNPGYLGKRKEFQTSFARPIERNQNEEATAQLRQITAPFILRRLKTDPKVIQDLPDKNEMKVYCNLSEEQASLYQAIVQDSIEAVEQAQGIKRKGLVLSTLLKLKQVCNHPAQFLHQIGDGQVIDPQREMKRSGKLARLTEMLEEAILSEDYSIIFTQFVQMGHFLQDHLQQTFGEPILFLHGGTPANKRTQMVQQFQEDADSPQVFILSLKAGGTGLNLTRANHVFHFDRWWNPAVEDQATDRAFRIGQTRDVQVHKFICGGTLEEKIDAMIESKKALAEQVIGGGESWLTELSTSQLRQLIGLQTED